MNAIKTRYTHLFCGALLLAGLFFTGGCDVLTQQDEDKAVVGTYVPAPGDTTLGFGVAFTSSKFGGERDTTFSLLTRGDTVSLRLEKSSGTQPGGNKENDGRFRGRLLVENTMYASSDSVQKLFPDTLDYTPSGDYLIAIDRVHLRIDPDSTEDRPVKIFPTAWEFEDGVLQGSTTRTVKRNGRTASSKDKKNGKDTGTVTVFIRLQKQ